MSDTRLTDTTGSGAAGANGLPPTQLLERNLDRIQGERLLLLGVPNDPKVVPLFRRQSGALLSYDYSAHLVHSKLLGGPRAALAPVFGATLAPPDPRFDVVVAYLQKGKDANDLLLTTAGSAVAPGGRVFLVGENAAGIKPYRARLEERVGPVEFSDAARHCVVFEARSTEARAEIALDTWEKRFHVPTSSGGIDVVSLPGVFSHGRLDEGTAYMLPHLPPKIEGAVLDFGCGAGVIGALIKAAHPTCDVTLVDSNAFAIRSTERTFSVNGLTARAIRAVGGIDDVGDQTFDVIVTNPPFHQGIGTDYTVVSRFLEACEQRLNNGGVLLMVANRFLPYERMIPKTLQIANVAENAKYKVLKGKKSASSRPARLRS